MLQTNVGPLFNGKTSTYTSPSSREITIRETNGDDDEILSDISTSMTGENINNFLANIVMVDSSLGDRKPEVLDILKWPVNDKYYTLLKHRILSFGDLLKFTKTCQNEKCPTYDVEQDLKEFDSDLSKNRKDTEDTSKGGESKSIQSGRPIEDLFRIRPYKLGLNPFVEFITSSGKTLRFKILTGELERKQLDMPGGKTNKNTKLIIRELEVQNKGNWELVTHFNAFSSRETSEIRSKVLEFDTTFDPQVLTTCPSCGQKYSDSLLSIPAFYFPEEGI